MGEISTWDPGLLNTLNLILEARFPMFIAWGPDLRLLYNDAYEPALLGKIDVMGRPMREVFVEAWAEVGELLAKAMAGHSSYLEDYHVPLVRNSRLGSTWWSFSYSPVRTQSGEIGGVLGVVYETTRRLLTDEALRSSEASIRTLADSAPGLLWRCEPDGLLTWANQRLEDYFGDAGLGFVRWDDRVHPDDIGPAQQAFADFMADGRPFEFQQRLLGRDGSYRWFMVKSQQVLDAGGQLIEWCGAAIDIHEWRLAAERIDERDQILRDFHGADATLMWVADVATRHVDAVNVQSMPAWALPHEDTIGWEAWADGVHPSDRPMFLAVFDAAASGKTTQLRFRRLTDIGPARWFHMTAFPLGSAGDRIGGLLVELGAAEDPRVFLVQPDTVDRRALSRVLSQRGFKVRVFDLVDDFERVCEDLCPGCVILAADESLASTIRVATLLKDLPQLKWLATGAFENRLQDVVTLMKLGASDVLSSPTPDAIAVAGQAAFDLTQSSRNVRPPGARTRLSDLSPREREVLEGLVKGGTNKTIAQKLALSPRTVETHRAHLMDRLGVSTLAELVGVAAAAGLGGPEAVRDDTEDYS